MDRNRKENFKTVKLVIIQITQEIIKKVLLPFTRNVKVKGNNCGCELSFVRIEKKEY